MVYVGIGCDIHRFVENRKLILGGVCFDHSLPYPKPHLTSNIPVYPDV